MEFDKDIAQEIVRQLRGTRKLLPDVLGEVFGGSCTNELIALYTEKLDDMVFMCDECKRWKRIEDQSTTGLVRSCDRCFDSGILN